MDCNKVSLQTLLDCFGENNIENNGENLEHNAEKLQKILNRIIQGIVNIIASSAGPLKVTGLKLSDDSYLSSYVCRPWLL